MNNRVGGLLILGIVFGLGYLFYWYYFVYSLVNITFNTNVEQFTISMESQHKNYNFTCEQSSCDYVKISPFEYQVTLKSAEHKDINYTWKPSKQNAVQNLEFQKDYSLESVSLLSQKQAENILNETIESQQEETIQEKIQKLKDKQTVHLRIEIDNNIYTFKKNNRELSLYQNEKKLGNFEYAEKSQITLQEIISSENYLAITLGKNKYLFSKNTGKTHNYDLQIPIEYIKATDMNGEFIFVTQKGSFIYNIYENKFQYNSYFSDFVFFNKDSLVGIINSNDIDKQIRFDNINNKNLIVLFQPNTKKQEILLETDKIITKIFKIDGKIYFEDENSNTFSLSHLEE